MSTNVINGNRKRGIKQGTERGKLLLLICYKYLFNLYVYLLGKYNGNSDAPKRVLAASENGDWRTVATAN